MSAEDAGNLMIGVGAVGGLYFILRYSIRPWRSTAQGMALMFLVLALTAILVHLVITAYWGHYPGWFYVRLGIYAAVAVGMWVFPLLIFSRPIHTPHLHGRRASGRSAK